MKHIIAISVAIILLCAIGPNHSSVTCEESLERIPLEVENILGQPNEKETMLSMIVPNRGLTIGGVHVDISTEPNRIYVLDAGNNRILGFDGYEGPDQEADIVIGQVLPRERGTANGDNTRYMPASSATLALRPYPNVISPKGTFRVGSMTTDQEGNLYVVDLYNNRVLKYNDPFTTDKIADEVWGQKDFIERRANRGQSAPTKETLNTSTRVKASGVDIDKEGNLWVTDSGNHRVLRYPKGSKTADLVLGQDDFEHKEASPLFNKPLNRMRYPSSIKIDPDTGDVYVLEGRCPGDCRILIFEPPFTNGASAVKEIGRAKYQDTKPEKPYNAKEWESFDKDGDGITDTWVNIITGLNRANGFTLDSLGTGVIALSDCNNNRIVFFDEEGNIKRIIKEYQAPDKSIKELYRPSGEIGLDEEGNLYVVSMGKLKGVLRFNPLEQGDTENDVIEPNGFMLKSTHWNSFSGKTFYNAYGFSMSDEQVYVSDGERILVWDRDNIETFAKADYVIGQENFGENFTKKGIFSNEILGAQVVDESNRLWVSTAENIYIFQTPITESELNPSPIKVLTSNKNVYWKDDTETAVEFKAKGIYYNDENDTLWIVDQKRNRALHIKDPLDEAVVDLVIGQRGKDEIKPNAGYGEDTPMPFGLSSPTGITMDRLGNLYIIDASQKLKGNRRVIRFSNAEELVEEDNVFPLPKAEGVFTKPHLKTRDIAGARKNAQPASPNWVTFNSENHMVLLADSFGNAQNERAYLYYTPHEGTNPQPGRLIEYPFGQATYAHFDEEDNLIIQDHTWNRILFGRLPYVKKTPPLPQPLPSAPTGKPDLIIDNINYTPPLGGGERFPGTEVTINVRVRNRGTAPTDRESILAVAIVDYSSASRLPHETHWPNSATLEEEFLRPIKKNLMPGEIQEITFSYIVDYKRTLQKIFAYADWGYISFEDLEVNIYNKDHVNTGVIPEINEINNKESVSFGMSRPSGDEPDLDPYELKIYTDDEYNNEIKYFSQLPSGQMIFYVQVLCLNTGNIDAVPNPEVKNFVLVEFKDKESNIIYSLDGPLGKIPPLYPYAGWFKDKFVIDIPEKKILEDLDSVTISYTINPDDRYQDSRYQGYVPLEEITYENNTISRKFLKEPVVKKPDLRIRNFLIRYPFREFDKSVNIIITVENDSMYDMEEETKLAVVITDHFRVGVDIEEEYLFWPVNEEDKNKFLLPLPPLKAWESKDIEFTWICGDGEFNSETVIKHFVYAYVDFKYRGFADLNNLWRPYYINEGKIEEKNESNNRSRQFCGPKYGYNYSVESVNIRPSNEYTRIVGRPIIFDVNVKYTGPTMFLEDSSPKIVGGIFTSNNRTLIWPKSVEDEFFKDIKSMEPNQTKTISFTWTPEEPNDNYRFITYVDWIFPDDTSVFAELNKIQDSGNVNFGVLEERDEGDNRFEESFIIHQRMTEKSDLIISQVEIKDRNNKTVSSINYTGSGDSTFDVIVPNDMEDCQLCLTVKNTGDGDADSFEVFVEGRKSTMYPYNRSFSISNLSAGKSHYLESSSNMAVNDNIISITADYYNNISESNEDNNSIKIKFIKRDPASDYPDLTISSLVIGRDYFVRDTLTPMEEYCCIAEVFNVGGDLPSVVKSFVHFTVTLQGRVYEYKKSKPIELDNGHQSSVASDMIRVPHDMKDGDVIFIEVEVDPVEGEVAINNNKITKTILVVEAPVELDPPPPPPDSMPSSVDPRAEVIDLRCKNDLPVYINEEINIVTAVQNKGTNESIEDTLEIKVGDRAAIPIEVSLDALQEKDYSPPGVVTFSKAGDYTITASTGYNSKSMVIHVISRNRAPKIVEIEENAHIPIDSFYYLEFQVKDPDGDTITVEVSGFDDFDPKAPSGFIVPPERVVKQTIRILPRSEHIGQWHTGTLTVSDGKERGTVSQNFSVFVEAPEPEPFIEIIDVNVRPPNPTSTDFYVYKPVICDIKVKNTGNATCYEQDLRLDIVMTWNTYSLLTETIKICDEDEGPLGVEEERTISYTWDKASPEGQYYFSVTTGRFPKRSYGGAGCEVLPYDKVNIKSWEMTPDAVSVSEGDTVNFKITVENTGDVVCEEEYIDIYIASSELYGPRVFSDRKNICAEGVFAPSDEAREFIFTWDNVSSSGDHFLYLSVGRRSIDEYPVWIYVQPK